MGARRRAVRAQDRLPGAGHLHHPAVDPVPAAGDRGRPGLAARRGVRRDLRGAPAAADRHPARFDPRQHGRRRRGTGLRPIGSVGAAIGGFLKQARRRGRHLRPDPGAGDPARAARHVRPLAQDQALLLDLPDVQGADLQAAEDATCGRSGCDELLRGRQPLDQLRRHQGRRRRELRRASRARSSPSSAPTAPARPRSSTWSAASTSRRGGKLAVRRRGHHQRAAAPHRRAAASRAPSRTSSCSSTRRCCRTCCSAAMPTSSRASSSELLFLPSVRRMELEHREAVEKVDRLPRPAAIPRQPHRQPALRRAQGGRAGARAVHRAQAAAARRALLRPERRGDRGHGLLDPGHQEPARHHRADGRARHEPGLARCPTACWR